MEEERINRFFVDVACDVGINASIIYFDICYWCAKNQEEGEGFYMYSTMEDFSRRMPYLTVNQVRTALQKLRNGGYIQAKTLTVNHYSTNIGKDLCDRILGLNPQGGKFPNHFGFKPNDLKEEERKKEKKKGWWWWRVRASAHTHARGREREFDTACQDRQHQANGRDEVARHKGRAKVLQLGRCSDVRVGSDRRPRLELAAPAQPHAHKTRQRR